MTATREEIDAFHEFAASKINNGGAGLSLEQLLADWRATGSTCDLHVALRQAIAEMRAGEGQPLDEALEEIRKDFGFPSA
jgi:hypothetical protein